MTNFEKFELKFKETYNDIYDFMNNYTIDKKEPLLFEKKENNDDIYHDSYGNESSTLERVFYFTDYEVYVKFKGTRQSYSGEEWENMKEVRPTTKIINTFE